MSSTKLELHIGRRRAAPDFCPECGAPSKMKQLELGREPLTLSDLLKLNYGHPNRVEERKRSWPWHTHTTWYYVCYHMSPVGWHLQQESLLWNSIREKLAKWKEEQAPEFPF